MALKTEIQYEDIFGNLVTTLTGLNRNKFVRPMKQINGTRVAKVDGPLLKGLTPNDDWCTYHCRFDEDIEEPRTEATQDKVFSKRFIKVEYNFYGPNSHNNILSMMKLHYTNKAYEELIVNNIVYSNVEQNVIDMDEVFNSQYWTRRNMIINYLENVEIEFPIGVVEEVDATQIDIKRINEIE